MADQPKIGIAVIGLGAIGPRHARSIIKCSGAKLLCIVDPSPYAGDIAQTFNVPLFDSVHRMLHTRQRPDAAIVCTPNGTHVDMSKTLLEAGIHVMVEKPLSTTIPSSQALLQAARVSGKHLLVGHHRRFNPYVTATKRVLTRNAIGRPIAISGLWCAYKPAPYFDPPSDWRADPANGGAVLINLIHEVDTLQFLFGAITRVCAEQTASQRGHGVEEGAAILLRFASGVVGTCLLSDANPSQHSFESGTGENPSIPRAGKDFYRIFGSEGTFSVGDIKAHQACARGREELDERARGRQSRGQRGRAVRRAGGAFCASHTRM